ncbi:hypothetical protein GTY41_25610, partial [Streptomyces sp. SID685]|nr:hypothetical protein [Streptomyces sp. SID685]
EATAWLRFRQTSVGSPTRRPLPPGEVPVPQASGPPPATAGGRKPPLAPS